MADRFVVFGQIFIVDGTAVISTTGRKVADTNFTCVGAGNFKVYMANGTTGTLSGTNVQGTPVALAAGENTITTTGAVADGVIDITIGTAANTNDVNSWSASSGGQCGASIPTSADNFYADANSFTAGSQVLTVNATSYCKDMTWTGATNSPTLAGTSNLLTYGNVTLISTMTISGTGMLGFYGTGTKTLTTNTVSIGKPINIATETLSLADALNITSTTGLTVRDNGTLVTNGNSVTTTAFTTTGYSNGVITLGNSTLNCSSLALTGTNTTLSANTATINCSGNFLGGSIATYHIVNLTGSTSTVSGSNTFATLGFTRAGVQTVSFTDGTTQTVTALARDAGTSVKTLRGTGTAGWAIVAAGAATNISYVSLAYSAASPANKFYYGIGSTVGIGNSGWQPYQSNQFGIADFIYMGDVA